MSASILSSGGFDNVLTTHYSPGGFDSSRGLKVDHARFDFSQCRDAGALSRELLTLLSTPVSQNIVAETKLEYTGGGAAAVTSCKHGAVGLTNRRNTKHRPKNSDLRIGSCRRRWKDENWTRPAAASRLSCCWLYVWGAGAGR